MSNYPSPYDDVIDSRDVISAIEELESELEDGDISAGDLELLENLKALADEAHGYASDWTYGETLIHEDYFTTYAQELAEDIGAVNSDQSWPNSCIDWDQAARDLQMDYTACEFDDATYYVRCS